MDIQMNLIDIVISAASQFWYFSFFIIIAIVFKSSWLKGVLGEFIVNRILSSLPSGEYTLIKNVTLPTEDGTTQLDHIVLSRYGVFVVETKNMKGWIFGGEKQSHWTQKIYKHSVKFQNPLRQNYKHIKTLQFILGSSDHIVKSVVVFVGDSKFKSEMPPNVTYSSGCKPYISSFKNILLSDVEVSDYIKRIEEIKLTPGLVTDYMHKKHVKELVSAKENYAGDICPKCGSALILRESRRGKNVGSKFWGCSQYPKCRVVIKSN